MGKNEAPVLACTLELQDMGPRLERLRRLADTSLRSHRLEGNVLRLAYRADAAAEVKAVVELERDCCQFLDFRLEEGSTEVELSITAPTGVGRAAEWLFAQFLPSTPAKAPARPCCATCS